MHTNTSYMPGFPVRTECVGMQVCSHSSTKTRTGMIRKVLVTSSFHLPCDNCISLERKEVCST